MSTVPPAECMHAHAASVRARLRELSDRFYNTILMRRNIKHRIFPMLFSLSLRFLPVFCFIGFPLLFIVVRFRLRVGFLRHGAVGVRRMHVGFLLHARRVLPHVRWVFVARTSGFCRMRVGFCCTHVGFCRTHVGCSVGRFVGGLLRRQKEMFRSLSPI